MAKALQKIKRAGLLPAVPDDMHDECAVYFFGSREEAEEGVMNWLGDRFDDDEELVLLTIDAQGLEVHQAAGYEWLSLAPVPPSAIMKVEPI